MQSRDDENFSFVQWIMRFVGGTHQTEKDLSEQEVGEITSALRDRGCDQEPKPDFGLVKQILKTEERDHEVATIEIMADASDYQDDKFSFVHWIRRFVGGKQQTEEEEELSEQEVDEITTVMRDWKCGEETEPEFGLMDWIKQIRKPKSEEQDQLSDHEIGNIEMVLGESDKAMNQRRVFESIVAAYMKLPFPQIKIPFPDDFTQLAIESPVTKERIPIAKYVIPIFEACGLFENQPPRRNYS